MAKNNAKKEKITSEQTENARGTRQVLRNFAKKRGNLIPILQEVQGKLGYLPREAMLEVAEFLGIPSIDVYEVVTFYNQFRLNPPGRHSKNRRRPGKPQSGAKRKREFDRALHVL